MVNKKSRIIVDPASIFSIYPYKVLLGCLLFFSHHLFSDTCLTSRLAYEVKKENLIENLISYANTKWLSRYVDIPILYVPFKGSDHFMLSEIENVEEHSLTQSSYAHKHLKARSMHYPGRMNRKLKNKSKVIYHIPSISCISVWDNNRISNRISNRWKIIWNDSAFLLDLKKALSPRSSFTKTQLPKDCFTIGLYMELEIEGVGKLPDDFYVDQLKALYQDLSESTLVVRIYADTSQQKRLLELLSTKFTEHNLNFEIGYPIDCSTEILPSLFFELQQVDCLIHSGSNLSYLASLSGNNVINICPKYFHLTENIIHIDEVLRTINYSHLKTKKLFNLGFFLKESSILTEVSGGRFGDQLVSYLHGKWLSYLYDVPIENSHSISFKDLAISEIEINQKADDICSYKRLIYKNSPYTRYELNDFFKHQQNSQYIIPYFPLSKWEYKTWGERESWPSFDIDWKQKEFKKELQKTIRPKEKLNLTQPPMDKITVCIHIRRGVDYDGIGMEQYYPLKFPPNEYYIEQLRWLYNYLDFTPLHVHIFTDDSTTSSVLELFRKEFVDTNINFVTRLENNFHTNNVLEDFFSFQKFDCIIHSESNFSYVASLIGDFLIKIRPITFHFEDKKLFIDESDIEIDETKLAEKLSLIENFRNLSSDLLRQENDCRILPARFKSNFGRQLINLFIAEWFSYKTNFSIIKYPSVENESLDSFSIQKTLTCDDIEQIVHKYRSEIFPSFTLSDFFEYDQNDIIYTNDKALFAIEDILSILKTHNELEIDDLWNALGVDWKNIQFKNKLTKSFDFQPKNILPIIPKETLSVALYLKNHDNLYGQSNEDDEQKLISFTTAHMENLRSIVGDVPLFIGLFSDQHPTSEEISSIKMPFSKCRVKWVSDFAIRDEPLSERDECFLMQQFDCIIHNNSSLAYAVSLINNFKYKSLPSRDLLKWEDSNLIPYICQ